MKKILIMLLIVLLISTGCANNKYGEPQEKLYNIEKMDVKNSGDLVLFTYVTYEDKRTTVLFDLLTKKQYDLTKDFLGMEALSTNTIYLNDREILLADRVQETIHKLSIDGKVTSTGAVGGFIGINRDKQFIYVDDREHNEIKQCSYELKCSTLTKYLHEEYLDDIYTGYYSVVNNNLFYIGKYGEEKNTMYLFNEQNEWEEQTTGFDKNIPMTINLIASKHCEQCILLEKTDEWNEENDSMEQNEEKRIYNIETKQSTILPSTAPIYYSKATEDGSVAILYNSTLISIIDVEEQALNIKEEYNAMALIPTGIQRINSIEKIDANIIVISTPEGLVLYDKINNNSEFLIHMDVDKV